MFFWVDPSALFKDHFEKALSGIPTCFTEKVKALMRVLKERNWTADVFVGLVWKKIKIILSISLSSVYGC